MTANSGRDSIPGQASRPGSITVSSVLERSRRKFICLCSRWAILAGLVSPNERISEGRTDAVYAHAYRHERLTRLLDGHERAFRWFGEVTLSCLYDSPRQLSIGPPRAQSPMASAIRGFCTLLQVHATRLSTLSGAHQRQGRERHQIRQTQRPAGPAFRPPIRVSAPGERSSAIPSSPAPNRSDRYLSNLAGPRGRSVDDEKAWIFIRARSAKPKFLTQAAYEVQPVSTSSR